MVRIKSLEEGAVFLVPYGGGRRALGVIARRQPRGAVMAVYVFQEAPPADEEGSLGFLPAPRDAVFRGRMSDQYVRTGEWPSLGVHSSFQRSDWPFDKLGHKDAVTGRCKAVLLDDRNPLKMLGLVDVDCSVAEKLPGDAIYAPDSLVKNLLPSLDVPPDP